MDFLVKVSNNLEVQKYPASFPPVAVRRSCCLRTSYTISN